MESSKIAFSNDDQDNIVQKKGIGANIFVTVSMGAAVHGPQFKHSTKRSIASVGYLNIYQSKQWCCLILNCNRERGLVVSAAPRSSSQDERTAPISDESVIAYIDMHAGNCKS